MQVGNQTQLDASREALRDAFDAIWMAAESIGPKESRAIKCAIALDQPSWQHISPNWMIFPGGRACGDFNKVILA